LKIEAQKDILFSSLIGKKSNVLQQKDDAATSTMAVAFVQYMLNNLDKIGKKEAWLNRTEYHSFKIFMKLSVKGKTQYHNELQKYHDTEMGKHKQPPLTLTEPVKASSPEPHVQGGCPDFNDPKKWEKI
jgi:hypothetical protein